ncbi:MAG: tetratricopeptide repeat protein [Cyanobacteria bacterium P01_F01_bin.86]
MTSSDFSTDWIKQFSDPFAAYSVLGVAVTADERRISKRYRQIAKQLHPDQQLESDDAAREFAKQMLTRLVNPAYQRLKQDKGRAETLATLRFKVRRMTREEKLVARHDASKQLMEADEAEVEMLYEKVLAELSETQYSSAELFAQQTKAITELNLIYLRRKMGAPIIREKRIGLVASPPGQKSVPPYSATNTAIPSNSLADEIKPLDYAQRHVNRAKIYINNKNYPQAIQELRDAVRLDPKNSNYHSMLGQAYLLQKLVGAAKVYFRQSLILDPNNLIALKYAKKLDIAPKQSSNHSARTGNSSQRAGSSFSTYTRSSTNHQNGHRGGRGFLRFFTRIPTSASHKNYGQGWWSWLFGRSFSRK